MQNRLTVFLDRSHGFIGLDYEEEDKKPIHLYAGLYPSCERKTDNCPLPREGTEHYSSVNSYELISFLGPLAGNEDILMPFFSSGSFVNTLSNWPSRNENTTYCIAYEGHLVFSNQSGIEFYRGSTYDQSYIQSLPQVSYNISIEGARRAFNRVKYLAENCDTNYDYNALTHNCLFFAKELHAEAGLGGGTFSEVYKMPIGYNIAGLFIKTYDALAANKIDFNYLSGIVALIALNRLIKYTGHQLISFFSEKKKMPQEKLKEKRKPDTKKTKNSCCLIL